MKAAELKSWLSDCADDAEITLFVNVDGESFDIDIETMITTEDKGVKKYYLHGGAEL